MPIYSGSNKIKEIWVGSSKIKEVWAGNDLVWKLNSRNPSIFKGVQLNEIVWGVATSGILNTMTGICNKKVQEAMMNTSVNFTFTDINNNYENVPDIENDIWNLSTWYATKQKYSFNVSVPANHTLVVFTQGSIPSGTLKVGNEPVVGSKAIRSGTGSMITVSYAPSSDTTYAITIVIIPTDKENELYICAGYATTVANTYATLYKTDWAKGTKPVYADGINFYLCCCAQSYATVRLNFSGGVTSSLMANDCIIKDKNDGMTITRITSSTDAVFYYIGLIANGYTA